MKRLSRSLAVCAFVLLRLSSGLAQSLLQYDQQSSDYLLPPGYGDGSIYQTIQQPFGQSFTPTLTTVGFIQLKLADANPDGNRGATVFVDLYSEALDGNLLASSKALTFPDGFRGIATFQFSDPVETTPGDIYYFAPRVSRLTTLPDGNFGNSDSWEIIVGPYPYNRGSVIVGGNAKPYINLWFREGVVVPEARTSVLLFLGVILLLSHRSAHH